MKPESTGTIRAYFMFFGLVYTFGHSMDLREGRELAWKSLIGLLLGVSYLGVGLALSALLSRNVRLIETVLAAGLCYSFLLAYARIFLYQEREPLYDVVLKLITNAFLILYVFGHVRRLSLLWRDGKK